MPSLLYVYAQPREVARASICCDVWTEHGLDDLLFPLSVLTFVYSDEEKYILPALSSPREQSSYTKATKMSRRDHAHVRDRTSPTLSNDRGDATEDDTSSSADEAPHGVRQLTQRDQGPRRSLLPDSQDNTPGPNECSNNKVRSQPICNFPYPSVQRCRRHRIQAGRGRHSDSTLCLCDNKHYATGQFTKYKAFCP